VTAAAEALVRIITAPTPRRLEQATALAEACGATDAEIDHVRGLWIRARRCVGCDHAVSSHDGDVCWHGPCGCAGFVSPDREDPQP
jgi:hypothetical protein